MNDSIRSSLGARVLLAALLLNGMIPSTGSAANMCAATYSDFGDAPENIAAYSTGVVGHFPSCLAGSAPGTQELCGAAVSTFPGITGYVLHHELAATANFWLGCYPGPSGVDSEADAKMALTAIPTQGCLIGAPDCVDGPYAQDECFGDGQDAGLAALPSLVTCAPAHLDLNVYSCTPGLRVYLNVLLDYNQDGDWNDKLGCGAVCAREWAIKNVPIFLNAGCNPILTPNFRVGPNAGETWMRVTISYDPVNDDFPWAGSATMAGGYLHGGETEDYHLTIVQGQGPTGCQIQYQDFGDAPEGLPAYATGILGHFPTCTQDTDPGNQEADCVPAPGTPPGPTGFVRHIQTADDVDGLWFGCSAAQPIAVDSEADGKVNLGTAPFSRCNDIIPVDCFETVAAGFIFGQDECYGDADAGLAQRVSFKACSAGSLTFRVNSCSVAAVTAYMNILVDWNEDGDWNDVVSCQGLCAPEWALKNVPVTVNPGCQLLTSQGFQYGPYTGTAWMRCTLSFDPVPDDFPWRGSAGIAGQSLRGGETEDYPVDLVQSTLGVDPSSIKTSGLWLAGAEPCPARTTTTMQFGLSRAGHVSLAIHDLVGRNVRNLVDADFSAGPHHVAWDLRDDRGAVVSPGVYFVRMSAERRVITRTAIVTR